MTLNEFKTLDPQRAVTVRFGMIDTEDGSTQWQEHWTDVRLFISSDHKTGEWLITPLSLDGRPMGFNLEGHDEPEETKGIFASPNTPHVMQVRAFLEPTLLVECAQRCMAGESENMKEALEDEFFFEEDLSREGRVFVTAIDGLLSGESPHDIIKSLCELMVA
jgi:hypothetical protein